MWAVAGVLFGLVVLASLVGFHVGPHAHAVAGGIGLACAAWLLVMFAMGQTAPLLYVLLGADVVISAGVGTVAWKGFQSLREQGEGHGVRKLDGEEGVAITALNPTGIVRVRGENWSATSLNGSVAAGTAIQVIDGSGVFLRVWGAETTALDSALDKDVTGEVASTPRATTTADTHPEQRGLS
jgi:membrane-bound ClpP family serine protease